MNYNNPQTLRTVRFVYAVCGSLFCIFTFLFLWKMQGGILGLSQHVLSKGKTVYSPVLGAIVLTFLFWLMQLLLNRLFLLGREWFSLSFFPSFLTLSFLCDAATSICLQEPIINWLWGYPLSLCLFIVIVWLIKHLPVSIDDRGFGLAVRLLIPNVFILLLLGIIPCVCASTNRNLYVQSKIDYLMVNHQYASALQVGAKTKDASKVTTVLRSYALARHGSLSDSLFLFPQYYGSEGLLLTRSDSAKILFSPDTLYHRLGAYPRYDGQPVLDYLKLLVQSPKAKPLAKDYYLCALLLDKKLPEFVSVFEQYYPVNDSVSLPRYYEEALVLYQHRNHEKLNYHNRVQEENYKAYKLCERQSNDALLQRNLTYLDFGDTYWWYYDYGKLKP